MNPYKSTHNGSGANKKRKKWDKKKAMSICLIARPQQGDPEAGRLVYERVLPLPTWSVNGAVDRQDADFQAGTSRVSYGSLKVKILASLVRGLLYLVIKG